MRNETARSLFGRKLNTRAAGEIGSRILLYVRSTYRFRSVHDTGSISLSQLAARFVWRYFFFFALYNVQAGERLTHDPLKNGVLCSAMTG